MPADILTGALLMLHGRIGDFDTGDVHASGLIMVAGSELIMAALAVALAVTVVRDRAGAGERRGPADPAADSPAELTAYNAYLAALDGRGRLPARARGSGQ
jgi:hypothetical protein